jgi:1-phosphofructokinase
MGKIVVLDTSGDALREGVLSKPTIIKPNRAECEELVGFALAKPDDLRCACTELLQRHEVVIISDGARGAWFAQAGRAIHATSPSVSVVDTTAAGDMLLGEFCLGFFPDRVLTPALAARATAMGAAAVERAGSDCPSRERIDELAALCSVTEYALG